MTTLYDNANAGPGTHVLAIGVGKYPHLIGGSGPLAPQLEGLGQLTSPPVSAKAFIQWCLSPLLNPDPKTIGFRNPACPLASLEALISADSAVTVATPTGSAALDAATLDKIKAAFRTWLQRIRSNEGNSGVFYFCGHGLMVADHYLLAEDFGSDQDQAWNRAFDISNTLRAVEREVKGPLYFFIDACKGISRELALTLNANPAPLRDVNLTKPVICASMSLIQAAGEGTLAFAQEGKVARFSDALITAMSGYCGARGAGQPTWDIDGELLASAIRKLLENANKTAPQRQVSEQKIAGNSVPLLKFSTIPLVKVALDLSPEEKRACALIYLQSANADGEKREHNGAEGVFQIEVPRGFYSVGARSSAQEFPDIEYTDQEIDPPLYGLVLQVQR